ncbi:MAG: serine/threonine-protein kinase [Chloroflexota bacterium]
MDVGVEFNQYRVVEHIGRGGMADVWSARDKRLNRTVAIKTIVRDMTQDAEPTKLFEREAQTIAQLEHPHILPIYDFGDFEAQLYIVMRYVTGGSLEDLLSAGPMGTADVLRLSKAIAGALDYAHSNHVIHLDLKPSNILMDSNQSPYLADFGLATVLGPEGRAANPGYGTLLYMAPEQLTASSLDHRADIYSFAILVFQMLTGELPFDATTSLALKQLQWQEDLPEVGKLGSDLAEALTPVLRRGTALDVNARPNTLMELVEELEAALAQVGGLTISPALRDEFGDDFVGGITVDLAGVQTLAGQDAVAKREAQDIYNKARRAWAYGQGRFLLGVTHFMVMNDLYMRAEELGLEIDEAGMQVLLRGAIEYDHEVDYWWNKLDNDNRRWVCLHAIRSENAPARTRAFYRLETLPDSDPPKIPMLVAQALAVETNEQAKSAAIHVLGTRAQRRKPGESSGSYTALPAQGVTGRLLTTRTRADIQMESPDAWKESIYSQEVDELLAEIALDPSLPEIAEQAARTVGRIRSLAALKMIAEEQRKGSKGALRALALVRDEAPSLPSIVSQQGRIYAWLANTWRRLSDDPLHNVRRFIFALIGAGVAMGAHVFITFRSEAIFNADRWGKTISIGLTFGMFTAILVMLSGEFPARLRRFWPGWMRLAVWGIVGFLWGTLTWGAFTWFFFNYPPAWDVMAYAGIGMALGFVLTALFSLRGWVGFLITAIAIYIPLYIFFQFYLTGQLLIPLPLTREVIANPTSILYYDYNQQIFTLAIPAVLLIALGGHAEALWRDLRRFLAWARAR